MAFGSARGQCESAQSQICSCFCSNFGRRRHSNCNCSENGDGDNVGTGATSACSPSPAAAGCAHFHCLPFSRCIAQGSRCQLNACAVQEARHVPPRLRHQYRGVSGQRIGFAGVASSSGTGNMQTIQRLTAPSLFSSALAFRINQSILAHSHSDRNGKCDRKRADRDRHTGRGEDRLQRCRGCGGSAVSTYERTIRWA